MANPPRLQIIISSGPEAASRAILGFTLAAAAVACGTQVAIFLVMNGARWALASEGNERAIPGFQPIGELIGLVLDAGGIVEVCSSCIEDACSPPGSLPGKRTGVVFGGLAAVALRMTQVPTVTF